MLTTEDIVALVRKLLELPVKLGVPEDSKDFAAEAAQLRARRSSTTSTSTSISATGACARLAS